MNYNTDNTEFNSVEQFKKFVIELLERDLDLREKDLVEGCFNDKTYPVIAESSTYSESYLKKAARKLFNDVRERTGEEINKKTFVPVVAQIYSDMHAGSENSNTASVASESDISYAQAENLNSFIINNPNPRDVRRFVSFVLEHTGNFSKTCKNIKENDGRLSATCMTRDGKPSQTHYNLDDCIANIDGDLRWFSESPREGGYASSCRNCEVEKLDSNSNAYLVCECQRTDNSWNTTRLNLDRKIDNENGSLWYASSLTTDYSA